MVDTVRLYCRNKKRTMKDRGLEFHLTESDIHVLLFMARITVRDIGHGGEQYCLARFGDKGHYTRGNCRFITQSDNLSERRIQPRQSPCEECGVELSSYKSNTSLFPRYCKSCISPVRKRKMKGNQHARK